VGQFSQQICSAEPNLMPKLLLFVNCVVNSINDNHSVFRVLPDNLSTHTYIVVVCDAVGYSYETVDTEAAFWNQSPHRIALQNS